MKIKILVLLIIFIKYITINSPAFAQTDNVVLFVNQVRGNECCQSGNLQNLEKQIETYQNLNFSATFNLRYDVLNNQEYLNVLKSLNTNQFQIGAFLEITPQLALDSNVEYKATENNWSRANYAYTLGYALEDRQKLIDTYMNQFYSKFGYYPKVSTAWIMDTDSLNYLHDKYNVESHQITREQWGTDSYTLYGGPVHYPYFASKNWAFMPTSSNNFDNKLLILRQTGSDPLYNYGDTSNAFTTQPNDYTIDGKNIDYFNKLSDELLFEQKNSYGFILLGVENSMDDKFQKEYLNQIEQIANKENLKTLTVSQFKNDYKNIISVSKINSLIGKDLVSGSNNQVLWINTNKYRARVIFNNHEIKITDIRLYDNEINDPYNSIVAKNDSFWVVPFLIDGSRFYHQEEIKPNDTYSKLRLKYLPEFNKNNHELKTVSYDFKTDSDGLIFSITDTSEYEIIQNNNSVKINYLDENRTASFIEFYSDKFVTSKENSISKFDNSDFLETNDKGLFFKDKETFSYGLNKECDGSCIYSFNGVQNEAFSKLLDKYYYLFFPEIQKRDVNTNNSIFYAHNQYSIQGKNPVRFVFMPRDLHGLPSIPTNELKVNFEPKVTKTEMHETQGNGTTFFDVYSNNIGKYKINFTVDGISKEDYFYIAPNCKENIVYCITHPKQSLWYLKSMFITRLRNF